MNAVTPVVVTRTQVIGDAGNWRTLVNGVDVDYATIRDWQTSSGDWFAEEDVQSMRKVVLLGKPVADQLFPGTDPVLRARLEADLAEVGSAAMHARLATVDPAAAERILPGNGRRIVRALEVVELTGHPFLAALPDPRYVRPAVQIGLRAPREVLDARIDARVDAMWAAGLVEEVRGLVPLGLREGRTAGKVLVRP